ncbi:MAG: N-acetylmuramoyl-L-alanine amidase [Flexilinea sp.]
MDSALWRYGLNQLTFISDVSANAQEQLQKEVTVVPSCNFVLENEPQAIVLHYTEGSLKATISTFQQPHNSSAHYVIDRDGKVYQLIPERFAAFHMNCYGNPNLCIPSCPICSDQRGNFVEPRTQSIGIELVNQGHIDPRYFHGEIYEDYLNSFGYRFWENYPIAQIESLKNLVEDIQTRWKIPNAMIMGHSRINNNVDPGPALNLFWNRYGVLGHEAVFP